VTTAGMGPAPVLVVDDEDGIRELVAFALRRAGFAVIEASSGQAALDIVKTSPVAMVVLDMGMPEVSGTYVVQALRANPETATLPVLLMTGSGVAALLVPGFEEWSWIVSVAGVFAAMWLRARRMQAHETDADLRAIELCGDPESLIRGLIRIYEINHIPRRWSSMTEERATHPSLARRIRTIRDRMAATHTAPEPIERLVVASSERGRYAVLDQQRVAFAWIDESSRRSEIDTCLCVVHYQQRRSRPRFARRLRRSIRTSR